MIIPTGLEKGTDSEILFEIIPNYHHYHHYQSPPLSPNNNSNNKTKSSYSWIFMSKIFEGPQWKSPKDTLYPNVKSTK